MTALRSTRIIGLILAAALLFQNCTPSRLILSKDDPSRIPSRLKAEERNRRIVVYLKNQEIKKGVLVEYDSLKLAIGYPDSQKTDTLFFSEIDKIKVEEKSFATGVARGLLIALPILYIVLWRMSEGWDDAFEGLGI